MEKKRRRPLFQVPKYQKHVMLLAVVPLFVVCYFTTCLILYFSSELITIIIDGVSSLNLELVKRWLVLILISLWFVFFLVLIWVYKSSSDLVGAFSRVIRELDEINEGKKKGTIKVRDNDILAKDLLSRVNTLIEKVQDGM